MRLLAIDGSASLCTACVFDAAADRELGRCGLQLDKGHAEHLIGVVAEALRIAATAYADLGAIAVATGPGSFTGLRVSIAAARGFALALDVPAVGVANLDAMAAETRMSFPGRAVMSTLDAGRDGVYLAVHDARGEAIEGPSIVTLAVAAAFAIRYRPVLAGTMALPVAEASGTVPSDIAQTGATADIAVYARLAIRQAHGAAPKPLYLRGPDAKPQAAAVPGIG